MAGCRILSLRFFTLTPITYHAKKKPLLSSFKTSIMGLDMMHTDPKLSREVITRHDNIVKSSEDKRDYRGIELQNNLKVLLASDPTTDKSAAALTVHIGSLSDPEHAPGLAHFCEHMLFMGTEKYPEENSYNKYLSEHGGSSNAFTSSDHTTYYFDIIPERLSSVLDIFAQFFISPLFTISCTDRELQAVNSEHDKNICSDAWRLDQLNKSTSDPNHPYHKFGTGNKDTLDVIPKKNGISIRDELLKFHSDWYSSNIMSLCIFGKESLDELEKMAIEMFSTIENKNVEIPKWPQHPYTDSHQGVQLKTVPIKDIRNLIMTFPIPDTRLHYKSAPSHYISHLIGHEGPGSLLSLLKAKGWCNSLSSSAQHGGRGFGMFNVNVDLTEDGINHTDDIVELLFQYINLLNKEGIQKWIFDEHATILATGFRFKDKEEPRRFVVGSVYDILEYPMEHVMSAHWHLDEWKPELIQELLSMLTPERIRIAVIGKVFEPICDQSEKWYGTKYCLEKISKELIERWSTCGLSENLAMPLPNSFLPDRLDLYASDPESKEYPSIVYDSPIMRVWHKQDNEYFLPKMDSFFEFTIPIAYSDPLNCGLNTLFVMLLLDSLNEYAYAAELAGINYQIVNTKSGLSIQMDGYDSKQHVLLECIIDKIVSFRVNPERFAIMKENYVRGLKNFETQQPYEHGAFYLGMMLTELAWSKKEYLEVAPAINLENLQDFIDRLFLKVHVECLIHGNIPKDKAIEFASIIEKKLPKNIIPLLPQQLTLGREIQLEKGSHYRLEVDHTIHCSSCAVIYFQCGIQSTLSNVLLELLSNILNEPCFNILRTKEQLGYIVFTGLRRSNGVQGLRVLVQSDRHPAYVESRIEAFLEHMDSFLLNQSDEVFENHREALIAEKLKRPKMLLGRSYMYRSEILAQQYHFDRVNVEVKALKQISKKQLYDFYKDIFSINSSNRKKLGVHVVSSAVGGAAHPDTVKTTSDSSNESTDLLPVPEDPSKVVLIEDIVTFKSGRGLYPLIAPYTNVPRKGTHCKL